MLAFSIWNAIWLAFIVFLFVNILLMLFAVITDLFRDDELSGWAKAAWLVGLLFLPLLGLLLYVIVRGKGMTQRTVKAQEDAQDSFDDYVRDVAGSGAATELEKAAAMHDSGAISDDEYAALKERILSS